MREILFRGKHTNTRQWIEGNLIIDERENYYIGKYIEAKGARSYYYTPRRNGKTVNRFIGIGFAFVIPETVGQYTGITDKNGKSIFEGDIVRIDNKNYDVQYLLGQFFVGINMPIAYKRFECEIIGNIHDNPELLLEGARK